MSRTQRSVLVAGLLLAVGSVAHADVVPMPAEDCPPGGVGETCHGGAYCAV